MIDRATWVAAIVAVMLVIAGAALIRNLVTPNPEPGWRAPSTASVLHEQTARDGALNRPDRAAPRPSGGRSGLGDLPEVAPPPTAG